MGRGASRGIRHACCVRDDHTKLRRRERAAKLIERGADLTAATAGGIGGLLLGGPPGALAGTGVGLAIREVVLKLGDEFEQRRLGPREKTRAGATLYWALREVEDRLEQGQEPRSDGFFAPDGLGGRSRADELLEAVLTRAINEHEERKLRHLGFMYGALVFCEDMKPGHANFLVTMASRLTWEQFVLIGLIHKAGYRALPEWPVSHRFSVEGHGVAGELYDLARQGIIARTDGRLVGAVVDINPSFLTCITTGCALYHLMRLDEIDENARAEVYGQLIEVRAEEPSEDWLARMTSTLDAERVTDDDLDRCRVRVPITDANRALFPPRGAAIEAVLGGVRLAWTVEDTDDPRIAALVPSSSRDREEFFAVVDEGRVFRVSQDQIGELWLD